MVKNASPAVLNKIRETIFPHINDPKTMAKLPRRTKQQLSILFERTADNPQHLGRMQQVYAGDKEQRKKRRLGGPKSITNMVSTMQSPGVESVNIRRSQ